MSEPLDLYLTAKCLKSAQFSRDNRPGESDHLSARNPTHAMLFGVAHAELSRMPSTNGRVYDGYELRITGDDGDTLVVKLIGAFDGFPFEDLRTPSEKRRNHTPSKGVEEAEREAAK